MFLSVQPKTPSQPTQPTSTITHLRWTQTPLKFPIIAKTYLDKRSWSIGGQYKSQGKGQVLGKFQGKGQGQHQFQSKIQCSAECQNQCLGQGQCKCHVYGLYWGQSKIYHWKRFWTGLRKTKSDSNIYLTVSKDDCLSQS